MAKAKVVTGYAHLLSMQDIEEIKTKFPAFLIADLSEKAISQKALKCVFGNKNENAGYYVTRATVEGFNLACFISWRGEVQWKMAENPLCGLRVCIQHKYDPDSEIVAGKIVDGKRVGGCEMREKTSWFYDEDLKNAQEVKSVAPIVSFAGIKYIWLNKTECENGDELAMRLVSLELLAKAEIFRNAADPLGENTYYTAQPIREQCEREALENASDQDRKNLYKVKVTSKDGYESARPILEKRTTVQKSADKSL